MSYYISVNQPPVVQLEVTVLYFNAPCGYNQYLHYNNALNDNGKSNVKGVTCTEEPTENYHLKQLPMTLLVLYGEVWLIVQLSGPHF